MKLVNPATLAGLLVLAGTVSAGEKMTADPDKSSIKFLGTKPDGKTQPGGFKTFTVDANVDFNAPNESTISIEIETKSIYSQDEKLTNHLKNPDFFNVRKYPKVTFKSTKVEVDHEKTSITGQWTMLGKSVEIKIPAEVTPTDRGLDMVASFKIDRTKWGMNYGEGKIDKDVKVDVKFALTR